MTFALFPSPFSSEVWDYGLRQRRKRKWGTLNSLSYPSGVFPDFFFLTGSLALCKLPGGNPGPQKIEPEDSGLSDHSHFSFLPIIPYHKLREFRLDPSKEVCIQWHSNLWKKRLEHFLSVPASSSPYPLIASFRHLLCMN